MLENPYCTVEEVQAELKNTDAAIAPTVEGAINSASRFIDQYKGRDFFQHDYSTSPLVIDSEDDCVFGNVLFLPYWPVIELTKVEVAGVEWVADTDYVAKGRRLYSLGGNWPVGLDRDAVARLTGKFGYAQTAATEVPTGIPDQIRRVAIIIAAVFSGYLRKDSVGLDGTVQQVTVTTLPTEVFTLLGNRKILL